MLNLNSKTLTTKQKRVFDYLCACLEKRQVSPTIAEIAKFLNVSSLRTVTQYLDSLEKKGLIVRAHHQARGIKIVTGSDNVLQTVTLPIVSFAGCDNMNVFAEQHYDEFVTIDRDFLGCHNSEKVVVFRALGDSMTGAGIETGDLVLTEMTTDLPPQQAGINQKDKVVAIVDGAALIKQISFSPNATILSPMSRDPQYRPIIMKKDFKVFGKVIEVIKGFANGDELTYESL